MYSLLNLGFTLGSYFNENIAMDIKVLHLIDHATRYSVGVKKVLISSVVYLNFG